MMAGNCPRHGELVRVKLAGTEAIGEREDVCSFSRRVLLVCAFCNGSLYTKSSMQTTRPARMLNQQELQA